MAYAEYAITSIDLITVNVTRLIFTLPETLICSKIGGFQNCLATYMQPNLATHWLYITLTSVRKGEIWIVGWVQKDSCEAQTGRNFWSYEIVKNCYKTQTYNRDSVLKE